VLAIALLVGGLAVVGGSPAQAATCPASTGSVAAAWSAIRSHGTVGATALRTERPEAFATQLGSWTVQQSVAVQRVHAKRRLWVAPDAWPGGVG
jgi:hypothetical protein